MSTYTSLGVTVSPEVAIYFLRFLKTLEDRPDTVTQGNDGSVSAVWEDRNHFDPWSSNSDYNSVVQFLRDLGEENYIYESVTEDGEPIIEGAYYFGFARVTRDIERISEKVSNGILNEFTAANGRTRRRRKRHGVHQDHEGKSRKRAHLLRHLEQQ